LYLVPGPYFVLYGAVRQEPTNHVWSGAPDQGAGSRPDSVRARDQGAGSRTESEEINLTFFLLISTYNLNLKYLSLFLFHHRLAHHG
jgi:hypothetical protein